MCLISRLQQGLDNGQTYSDTSGQSRTCALSFSFSHSRVLFLSYPIFPILVFSRSHSRITSFSFFRSRFLILVFSFSFWCSLVLVFSRFVFSFSCSHSGVLSFSFSHPCILSFRFLILVLAFSRTRFLILVLVYSRSRFLVQLSMIEGNLYQFRLTCFFQWIRMWIFLHDPTKEPKPTQPVQSPVWVVQANSYHVEDLKSPPESVFEKQCHVNDVTVCTLLCLFFYHGLVLVSIFLIISFSFSCLSSNNCYCSLYVLRVVYPISQNIPTPSR